jgi:cytochrome c-type biogenesis protein CcsB
MDKVEGVLIWGAAAAYALASVRLIYLASFRKERGTGALLGLTGAGIALQIASLAYRSVTSGHIPVQGHYENASTAAVSVALIAFVVALRTPAMRLASLAAIPLALLVLGYGLTTYDPAYPLSPPYKSSWLVIHVAFAQLAYGAFSFAAGIGLALILKDRRDRAGRTGGLLDRLPPVADLEDLIFRWVIFGFITSALMIVAGAFWADSLWGSYWSWDPVETWALVSWLTYGVFIHLRLIHQWHGPRLAWVAVGALAFVLVAYWFSDFFAAKGHLNQMPMM